MSTEKWSYRVTQQGPDSILQKWSKIALKLVKNVLQNEQKVFWI